MTAQLRRTRCSTRAATQPRYPAWRLSVGALWLVLCLTVSLAPGQTESTNRKSTDGQVPDPPFAFERSLVGLSEIAQKLIEESVTRSCQQRGLPESQHAVVRDLVLSQWRDIMDPRDPTVQALVSSFVEMRTGTEPPSPETLSEWGQLTGKILDRYRIRLADRQEAYQREADPDRRRRLELEIAVMESLCELSDPHVQRWRQGDFEGYEFWRTNAPSTPARAKTPDRPVHERQEQPPPPSHDPIALELEAWTAYVEDFIRRFKLDPGQRDAARSCLLELRTRADVHRTRYRTDIADLERRIQSKVTSPELEAEIQRDLQRLYGPVDDMFAELRARLNQLPTAKQRQTEARAAESSDPTP